MLASPGHELGVVERLGEWLRGNREWHALELRELPGDSPLPDAMTGLASRSRWPVRVEHGRCALLDLPGTFDEFVRGRAARFRTRLRAFTRKVDEEGSRVRERVHGP